MRRALVALCLLATASCSGSGPASIMDKDELTVAIRLDMPLISFETRGDVDGYDVAVAKDLTRRLGKTVRWMPIKAGEQLQVLADGRADLVFAHMSVTQERKKTIGFAGPYHIAHQDIAVRPGDVSAVRDVRDLAGRRICWVRGTNIATRIIDERHVKATAVAAPDYNACLSMIKTGDIDAISTDDTILAGLLTKPGVDLRIVGAAFNEQRTAVGIPKGDVRACEDLNRAITGMYQDGTARMLLDKWFGRSGIDLTTVAVPQFEGCS
ncbi:transporter substrate-binding domain-containing protein [Nonomuraea sp. NPDC050663]|uniref:transporter substrate-binding domain-containing protein n=1 Tax=Nonomuraea sp. NPDC050663 TaxID=3364370 RepID=UPI00378922E2